LKIIRGGINIMAINNATMEVYKIEESIVLVVERNGIKKFISKNWFSKKHINCTVLIDKAKRFNSEGEALKFYDEIKDIDRELSLVNPIKLKIQYSIDIEK
jgi:hypothetical protein